MIRKFGKNKAQTTLEYAILIGVIVAGLIAMQTYIKRGYQGKLRESADSMGQQFSPGYTTTHYETNSVTNSTENLMNGATTTDILNQSSNKTGNETVADSNSEFWFK
jgi:hypothetical protein